MCLSSNINNYDYRVLILDVIRFCKMVTTNGRAYQQLLVFVRLKSEY